jgi:hypothetical protein
MSSEDNYNDTTDTSNETETVVPYQLTGGYSAVSVGSPEQAVLSFDSSPQEVHTELRQAHDEDRRSRVVPFTARQGNELLSDALQSQGSSCEPGNDAEVKSGTAAALGRYGALAFQEAVDAKVREVKKQLLQRYRVEDQLLQRIDGLQQEVADLKKEHIMGVEVSFQDAKLNDVVGDLDLRGSIQDEDGLKVFRLTDDRLGDISEEHIGLIEDLGECVKQEEGKGVRLGHQLRSERNDKNTAEGRLNAVSAVLNTDMTSSEKKDKLQQANLKVVAHPIGANTPDADQQSINGPSTGDAYFVDANDIVLLAGRAMMCICQAKKAKHLPVYEDGTIAAPNFLYCGRCVHARMDPWRLQDYKDLAKPTEEELFVYQGYHSSCIFEGEVAHFKFGGSAFKKCEALRNAETAGRTQEVAEILEVLRGENNTHGGVYGKRICDFTRKPISHFKQVTNGLDPDTVNNFGNNGGFQRM